MKASWLLLLAPLLLAARPGSEWTLVQQLNGQPVRLVMADGGLAGIAGAGTANVCIPITTLKNTLNQTQAANVFMFVPLSSSINFCVQPSIAHPRWDGGCSSVVNDINYGTPAAQNVPQYFTPDSKARHFCAVGDAGTIIVPLWWVE